MEKQPLYVLDSYPALADVARVRYCAMVKRGSSESRATSSLDGYAESRPRKAIANRDPQAPRSRKALHGRGVQFLELRGTVCGTLTTVQKDTLLWIRRGDKIKF